MNVRRAIACAALTIAAVAPVGARAATTSPIVVSNVWSRPAIDTGVVYATIENRSGKADGLDGGITPIAVAVEVHRTVSSSGSMNGTSMTGIMSMQRVSVLPIPAHGRVTLATGAYHLMLIRLHRDLHAGDAFPLVLHFSSGGYVKTTVHVRPL